METKKIQNVSVLLMAGILSIMDYTSGYQYRDLATVGGDMGYVIFKYFFMFSGLLVSLIIMAHCINWLLKKLDMA